MNNNSLLFKTPVTKRVRGFAITLLLLCFAQLSFAQDAFISVWKTDNAATAVNPSSNTQVKYPGIGTGYTLEYQLQGTSTWTNVSTSVTNASGSTYLVSFPSSGTYLLRATPGTGTFTGFSMPFSNVSEDFYDRYKLTGVTQWGSIAWTKLDNAFRGAVNFTLTATDAPNLTAATNLSSMFYGASLFNTNISAWNTITVTNMQSMFREAVAFNQPLDVWNVTNVDNTSNMFYGATAFNQSLASWKTGNVTNMSLMFYGATAFNQPLAYNAGTGAWNTIKVINMERMFAGVNATTPTIFNQPIGSWITTAVTNMKGMFNHAKSFNQDISTWNTAAVKSMENMFWNAAAFNQNISGWNTQNVTNMTYMFQDAIVFNQDLGTWNLQSITAANNMLYHSALDCKNYSNTIIGWANSTNTPNSIDLGNVQKVGGVNRSYGGTAAQTAHNTLTTTKSWTITNDFFDAACNPLPVTFSSMYAGIKNNQLLVQWGTETETNCSRFEVQASKDGEHWKTIGTVNSKAIDGNSSTALQYEYSVPVSGVAILGLSLLLLSLLSFKRYGYKRWMPFLLGASAVFMIWFASCSKNDKAIDTTNTANMQIRIAQIDNDGTVKFSKVQKVVQE